MSNQDENWCVRRRPALVGVRYSIEPEEFDEFTWPPVVASGTLDACYAAARLLSGEP